MTPLAEHLDPLSSSGFLRACVLVIDVTCTAVRDAKNEWKELSLPTIYCRKELEEESLDINPESPKKRNPFYEGRGSSENSYSMHLRHTSGHGSWPQMPRGSFLKGHGKQNVAGLCFKSHCTQNKNTFSLKNSFQHNNFLLIPNFSSKEEEIQLNPAPLYAFIACHESG